MFYESTRSDTKNLLLKLKGVGIESISNLVATTASELLEDYYSNYDNAAKGIDIETISHAIIELEH